MLENLLSSQLHFENKIHGLTEQVLDLLVDVQALCGILVEKDIFSIDDFKNVKQDFLEAQPDVAKAKQDASDTAKVLDLLNSKEEMSQEDRDFLKEYGKNHEWDDSKADLLIEYANSVGHFKEMIS